MVSAFLEFVSLRQKILPFLKHENPGVINRTQSNVNFQMNRFQSNANQSSDRSIDFSITFSNRKAIEFLHFFRVLAWIGLDCL